jgi:hypothetical protein
MQSVPIIIKVVRSNSAQAIQHYVIKSVVFSTNKTDHHDITLDIVESGIQHHKQKQ